MTVHINLSAILHYHCFTLSILKVDRKKQSILTEYLLSDGAIYKISVSMYLNINLAQFRVKFMILNGRCHWNILKKINYCKGDMNSVIKVE